MLKKFLFILLIAAIPIKANAQNLSLIRDAEIEDFLHDLTKPIFKAANLNPQDIKIYIVQDNSLNAFVAGGQNVFINTGLIKKYSDPNVLIGVIAHETGHITGGHLARSSEDMASAGNAMILSYIAGLAAAVAASPDAGMAIIMGGSHIAQRSALKFSRTQEEAADALAIKYLDESNNSVEGLLKLLEYFNSEEKQYKDLIDEYAITHPISQKRINFIKANLSKNKNFNENQILRQRLKRIIAKLDGFLAAPDQVIKLYNTNSQNDKYARSIALFKLGKKEESINLLNELIQDNPQDAYLYDLKGQILAELSDAKNAIIAYDRAIKLDGKNNLARIALANLIVGLDSKDKSLNNIAINNLKIALKTEKDSPSIYKTLARAYNQKGDKGRSYLALAQMSYLEKNKEKTTKYIELAKENLDKSNKTDLIILDDLEEFTKNDSDH